MPRHKLPKVYLALQAAYLVVGAQNISMAEGPSRTYNPASVTEAICRQYAAAQQALPYDTMYAQCMYARGYMVPGFSPSPNSPGYQGELPGPPLHNGGA